MNEYEKKQANRAERYAALARRCQSRSDVLFSEAQTIISAIPPGQPILVDHYSANRHRATLRRHDSKMSRAVELSKKAKYYEEKAKSVGRGGVSSDDPDAVEKLRERLSKLEWSREQMKAANAAHRKAGRPKSKADPGWDKFASSVSEAIANEALRLFAVAPYQDRPFPAYSLTNLGANIRRIEARIKELEALGNTAYSETKFDGFSVIENPEENRIQLVFDGKPHADIRSILKRNGFRWSPRNGAWQRHLNNSGRFAAKSAAREINEVGL